jgi:hypothetical protein
MAGISWKTSLFFHEMNSSQSNLERKENRLHSECKRLQVHAPIIPPSSPRTTAQPAAALS